MSRLDELEHRFNADLVSVKTQWVATRQAWRDSVGDRFEREFWLPIEDQSRCYLAALTALDDELRQADFNTR